MPLSKKTKEGSQIPINIGSIEKSANDHDSENSNSNGDNNLHSRVSMKPKPFLSFLDLPSEIHLIIYELVFGVDQRIQIDCGLTKNKKNLGTFPVVRLLKF